jgi:hypothetical protein
VRVSRKERERHTLSEVCGKAHWAAWEVAMRVRGGDEEAGMEGWQEEVE